MQKKPGNCEDCGIFRKKLHPHHIIPRVLGGSDDPENIAHLCANCHEDRHGVGGVFGSKLQGALCHSPEAQRKRGHSMKVIWLDPEYRRKQSASRKEAWKKRDRAKQSQVLRDVWSKSSVEARQLHCSRISEAKKMSKEKLLAVQLKEQAAIAVRKHLGMELA